MTQYAHSLCRRAEQALRTAELDLSISYDAAASRAYYAAFYAVSALFELEGKEFSKHTAVRAAVHRDLVQNGRWAPELGEDYSTLMSVRDIADYGGMRSVSEDEARLALAAAKRILEAVRKMHPELDGAGEPPTCNKG